MSSLVPRDVTELTLRVCEGLGDPRSLTVAIMVRYGEWDALATLKCVPSDYLNAQAYAKAAASTALLRKSPDLPTSFDKAAEAEKNFWLGERGCYQANERLAPYVPWDPLSGTPPVNVEPRIHDFFCEVRKTVGSWLGPCPATLTGGRHGPGGTFSDRGDFTTIPDKMSSNPTLTRDAMWYLPQWLGTQWGHSCASRSRSPSFVKGNRFSTAPKDATKFRGICPEPSINVFYQLGLGSEIRRAIKRIGVDMRIAKDIHMRVACEASLTTGPESKATLDLSNASDSVCTNLVKLCTPRRWFEALADLRSPFTFVDGRWVRLEKFSSMGNGFTFELETLLFLALAVTACRVAGYPCVPGKDVYTYGDDIIVPGGSVRSVVAVLNFCGFQLNSTKSFSEGHFRESCGGDYFSGYPVRPFYLDEFPNEPQHWITVANGLRALSANLASPSGFAMVRRAWFYALDQLPKVIRECRGPSTGGDIFIHDDDRIWKRAVRWRGQIGFLRCYRPHRNRRISYGNFHPSVVLACATYGLRWNNGGVTPRDSVLGYKVGWIPRGS